MKSTIFVLIIISGFLGGCATAQKPSDLSNLQIKVAHLERKLASRDQEISELQGRVDSLSAELQNVQTQKAKVTAPKTIQAKSQPDTAKETISTSGQTIRVSASAKQIQTALKNAGYYNGAIDGRIGRQSKNAIKEFQKDHDLTNDGIVGKNTWEQMKLYID